MTRELFTKELLEEFKRREMTLTEISMEIYGHADNYRNVRRAYKRHQIEPYRRPKLKPSRETLINMIVEQGMNPRAVAEALGYGPDGWSNIYAYCREYGIRDFDFSANAEIKRKAITPAIGSVIHGTLLGDGSVNYKGIMRISHGEKQLDYLRWKQAKLEWLAMPEIKKRNASGVGLYSKLPTYTVTTHSHPYLRQLRGVLFADKYKTATPLINSPFWDSMALAVWYMDDGSLNTNTGVVTLATNGFNSDDVHALRAGMLERFEIESVDEPRRSGTLAIRINKTKTYHFFEVIMRGLDVPESMLYKFPSQ